MKEIQYKPFLRGGEWYGDVSRAVRFFYQKGEIFISDASVEAAILPLLESHLGAAGGAVFGFGSQMRFVFEFRKGKETFERQFGLGCPEIKWTPDAHSLSFSIFNPVPGNPEQPSPEVMEMADAAAAVMAVFIVDRLAACSGLINEAETSPIPSPAVSRKEMEACVSLDQVKFCRNFLNANPMSEGIVFTMMKGVKIEDLTLSRLFDPKNLVFDRSGARLSVRFTKEFEAIRDELMGLVPEMKPARSPFPF